MMIPPWLKGMKGEVYTHPDFTREGGAHGFEEVLLIWWAKGQIATQYIDTDFFTECPFNPNQSLFGIEGITRKVVKFLVNGAS